MCRTNFIIFWGRHSCTNSFHSKHIGSIIYDVHEILTTNSESWNHQFCSQFFFYLKAASILSLDKKLAALWKEKMVKKIVISELGIGCCILWTRYNILASCCRLFFSPYSIKVVYTYFLNITKTLINEFTIFFSLLHFAFWRVFFFDF